MKVWRRLSLRASITLWSVAVTLAVVLAYATAVFAFVSRSLSNVLDERLRYDFQWAATMADQEPDGTLKWFDEDVYGNAAIPWLQVWSGGRVIFRTAVADRNPIPALDLPPVAPDGGIVVIEAPPSRVRALSARASIHGNPVILQVVRSESPMRRELWELTMLFVLGLPLAIGAAGIGGFLLARRALAPIERMVRRARAITAARLSDRLPVQNQRDELGRLAMVFNETLGRLECSFDQMRRFTADVSHQLRTPLTAMTSVGEVALREQRPARAYRDVIESMLEDVDRMSSLVDRLLTLSRAESGQAMLAHSAIELCGLVTEVTSQLSVLAEEKGQALTVAVDGSPCTMGDRVVLREALMNLVDNAIKYTPAGGAVHVRAWKAADGAWIEVRDSGPGIPSEVRQLIFDRTANAIAPAVRLKAGGLGLSIAKWAIHANRGELSLVPAADGAIFRISLPPDSETVNVAVAMKADQRRHEAREDDHERVEISDSFRRPSPGVSG